MATASGPVELVQNVGINGSQYKPHCLDTSLILRKIFDYFTTRELMELSCVKKNWNLEARRLLRHRGSLTVTLSLYEPCQELVALVSTFDQMNLVPISGMTIPFVGRMIEHECQQLAMEELYPTYSAIIDRIQWRHFSVALGTYSDEWENCPVIFFATKVLQHHLADLEELYFDLQLHKEEFFQLIVQGRQSFPHLQVLKLGVLNTSCPSPAYGKFIKVLLSRTPNLKEIWPEGNIDFMEDLLDEASSAILHVSEEFHPSFRNYPESFLNVLRLERLFLDVINENVWMEKFQRTIPVLLQTSRSKLTSLTIDLVFVVPLMTYGIRLDKLRNLTIIMNDRSSELVQPYLQALDFTRLFPRLTKIHIRSKVSCDAVPEDVIGDFIEQGSAMLRDPPEIDRAENINHLVFCRSLEDAQIVFFAEIFPHIDKVSIKEFNHPRISKELIFENWSDLRELEFITEMDYPHLPHILNLDSVLCGIFPEEVEELRRQDDWYLRAVNIVPVMPSIACMRNLRTLTLSYVDPVYQHVEMDYHRIGADVIGDRTFILSKVTALVPLPRCPGLAVTFRTNVLELAHALDHMRPYVAFIIQPWEMIERR